MRLFRSPLQVFASFDLAVCKVGYSPAVGVVATESGVFASATSTIIADVTSFNATASLFRVVKYSRRNFTVIFPFSRPAPPPARYSWKGMEVSDGCFNDVMCFRQPSTLHAQIWVQREGTSRPKEEVGDYGDSVFEMRQLFLYNFRKARDGASDLFVTAASFDQLMDSPTVVGDEAEARGYFDAGKFLHPRFLSWPWFEPYTQWDIEERFDIERMERLVKIQAEAVAAPKDRGSYQIRVTALIDEMRDQILTRMAGTREHYKSQPLWDDVRDGPLVTPPWSGYLVRDEREFHGDAYYPLPVIAPPFEFCMTMHLLRTRCPLWGKLPQDVWRIISRLILPTWQRIGAQQILWNYFHPPDDGTGTHRQDP